jgi:hypothetical protein
VLADILFMSAFDRGCLITATPAHTSPSRPCANTAGKGKTEDTHNSPDFFFSLLFLRKNWHIQQKSAFQTTITEKMWVSWLFGIDQT